MPSPTWGGSPSTYQPNPTDDRATGGGDTYRALTAAIEEVESIRADWESYRRLAPDTRRALRTAESALRRAAYGYVVYRKEEEPEPGESQTRWHPTLGPGSE